MTTDTTIQIGARFDAELVAAIDKTAAEDNRNRSGQLAHLARLGLQSRQRVKEWEELQYLRASLGISPAGSNSNSE